MPDHIGGWQRFLPQSPGNVSRSRFAAAFSDQVICVVGAGGYIGSALAKTLAQAHPRLLVLLESSEQALFELQRSLAAVCQARQCESVLGSVCDSRLLHSVFSRFRPEVVFHAAAFKHVGLLERNPFAAIENNVLGTDTLVRLALRHGAARFVLVSTDKAVNPHSVMGVSKRLAELITLSMSSAGFLASAIRLGNVIGSTGSVVPIFFEQIASGGPVCVTHPEVCRYFLSQDEAVAAILAAGAAGCDAKVLLPDLGEPVRVSDLARFLICSRDRNGKTPLRFTGLAPGEKLSEDLIGESETRLGSVAGPLSVLSSRQLSPGDCDKAVECLVSCLAERDSRSLLRNLRELVPDYVPSRFMLESAGEL